MDTDHAVWIFSQIVGGRKGEPGHFRKTAEFRIPEKRAVKRAVLDGVDKRPIYAFQLPALQFFTPEISELQFTIRGRIPAGYFLRDPVVQSRSAHKILLLCIITACGQAFLISILKRV
jgi:hypothetical protein